MKILGLALLLPALALADEPTRVRAEDLAGLLWVAGGGGDCARGSDLLTRQCKGVQAARADAVRGRTFVVDGDAGALEPQADGTLAVRACLLCVAPPGGLYVTGRGGLTLDGERVIGPLIRTVPACGGAPRVELAFRLDAVDRWTQGGKSGAQVNVVDARLVDCDPAAAPAPAAAPLPAKLGPADVKAAMDPVEPEVARCFDRYGVPGSADVGFEVAADGELTFVEVRGEFRDTPTGACVVAAVKKAHFPAFQRGPIRLHYPFLLR